MMGRSQPGHGARFWPMRPTQKTFGLLTNEVAADMASAIIFPPGVGKVMAVAVAATASGQKVLRDRGHDMTEPLNQHHNSCLMNR